MSSSFRHVSEGLEYWRPLPDNDLHHRRFQHPQQFFDAKDAILRKMLANGWRVIVVEPESNHGVKFTLGHATIRLEFEFTASSFGHSSVIARAMTSISGVTSRRWEIFADNPTAWEHAVERAIAELREQLARAQDEHGKHLQALHGLPCLG